MSVSAIIVTYNRLDMIKKCVSKLLNQTHTLDYIIIINNNSSDGTTQYLNHINNKRIIIDNLKKNIGGAGGFSTGVNLAYTKTNSKYFWLMDDDSMPTKTCVDHLLHAANILKGNFGFLSSNVRCINNNKATNVPMTTADWSELSLYNLIKIKSATFVSFFIPRIRVKELGLPIADTFIWGDDTEYSNRLSQKFPCYFVPTSIVIHNSGTGNNTIYNEALSRLPFYKCFYRNDIYIYKKYCSSTRVIRQIIHILLILFKIPFKSNNHRLLRFYYTLSGLSLGFFFNPKVQFPHKRK